MWAVQLNGFDECERLETVFYFSNLKDAYEWINEDPKTYKRCNIEESKYHCCQFEPVLNFILHSIGRWQFFTKCILDYDEWAKHIRPHFWPISRFEGFFAQDDQGNIFAFPCEINPIEGTVIYTKQAI